VSSLAVLALVRALPEVSVFLTDEPTTAPILKRASQTWEIVEGLNARGGGGGQLATRSCGPTHYM